MKKEEKIAKTLKEDKCFSVSETDRYLYYLCKGVSGKTYDILYYKALDRWKCDCNNIRNTPCYHIEVAKIIKENENPETDIDYINVDISN